MRYIDTLKEFQLKYKFLPKNAMIQEYLRISDRADKENKPLLCIYALCHAMRLGYNFNE